MGIESIFPDYLENFFHSRHSPEIGGGYNWGGYSNSQFDELSLGLLSETTIDGARDKIFQLQQFLAEELPYVTLFTTPKLDAYRPSRIEFPVHVGPRWTGTAKRDAARGVNKVARRTPKISQFTKTSGS